MLNITVHTCITNPKFSTTYTIPMLRLPVITIITLIALFPVSLFIPFLKCGRMKSSNTMAPSELRILDNVLKYKIKLI